MAIGTARNLLKLWKHRPLGTLLGDLHHGYMISQRESISRFLFSISFYICFFPFSITSPFSPTSFVATTMSDFVIPVLPREIITEILLRVPPKFLLKFRCVSKPWLQLISSPEFVNVHLKLTANDKECSHHRVIFQDSEGNFKLRYLPSLFYKEQITELLDMASPMENPTVYTLTVGSVNGLICLYSKIEEPVLWNPTIRKSKKLPTFGAKLRRDCSYYCKYGFGYDESRDDYKVVVVQCISDDAGSYDTVVNIYSLRTDSWRTVDKFQGNFLVNSSGKCANGKLYWALSADVDTFNMCNIISLDLADETWRRLDLPTYEDSSYPLTLGVVGSDLSVLCPCRQVTNSDVWILKDCGVKVSWTKIFTIEHHRDLGELIFFSPILSVPLCQSNKGESLLLLPPVIMIYDGSTRQLKAIENEKYFASEIYVESLIDPVFIADRGRQQQQLPSIVSQSGVWEADRGCRNLETSQSFSC